MRTEREVTSLRFFLAHQLELAFDILQFFFSSTQNYLVQNYVHFKNIVFQAFVVSRCLPIRLLHLMSQNYVISHWVVYDDVKYDELNEVFTVFSNLFET